jgi:hypothetical protein
MGVEIAASRIHAIRKSVNFDQSRHPAAIVRALARFLLGLAGRYP